MWFHSFIYSLIHCTLLISCFALWSSSVSQNEMKISGDHQVLHHKKKNDIIFKKKSSNGKPNNLKDFAFTSGKLFLSDSICYENQQLLYRCRQLKRQSLLHSAWFISTCIYIKVGQNSDATRIKHRRHWIWKTLIPILESMFKFP